MSEEEKLNEEVTEEHGKNKKKAKFERLESDLEKARSDVNHWKNEYYRAYADTQNLRKSLEKDHLEAMKYRAEGFIEDLLPVLDSFHMALANEPTDPALKNYLVGFQYIYRNLVSVLENEGVKEFAPKVGDEFDAGHMQAVETVIDKDNPNKVVKVITNGYKLHDHLIRPAMVIVSIKEEVKKDEEQTNDEHPVDA